MPQMSSRLGMLLAAVGAVGWIACGAPSKPAAFRYCLDTTPEQEKELAGVCAGCPEFCSADCVWHKHYDDVCGQVERRTEPPWWQFWR